MSRVIYAGVLLLATVQPAVTQFPPGVRVDAYGGDPTQPCSSDRTGYFYVYRNAASHQWWVCDPANNRFFMLGVCAVDAALYGETYRAVAKQLYGSERGWYTVHNSLLPRLQSYGFNTVGDTSSNFILPVPTVAGNGGRELTTKMPFTYMITPARGFGHGAGSNRYFKDIVGTTTDAYRGWRASSFPDLWDPNWTYYANYHGARTQTAWGNPTAFTDFSALDASPYLIGIEIDTTDQVWGFRGSKMDTAYTSWFVAATTPLQVISGRFRSCLYADPTMHIKQEWANWLQANGQGGDGQAAGATAERRGATVTLTVGTNHPFTVSDVLSIRGCSNSAFNTAPGNPVRVSGYTSTTVTYTQRGAGGSATGCRVTQGPGYTLTALNAAWGASYTSFGTSGTTVTGELVGTGDGSTTSFRHTLAHSVVDPWSVALMVEGTVLGGDCPWFDNVNWKLGGSCGGAIPAGTGVILGGAGTAVGGGSVDYRNGALTVNFSKPPARGSPITANYVYGGWPHALAGGTGLLDEDSSNGWFPHSASLRSVLQGANPPRVDVDLSDFMTHLAQKYYSTLAGTVRALLPHHLVFSNDWMGPFLPEGVLQQAGRYLDVLISGEPSGKGLPVPDSEDLVRMYDTAHKPIYIVEEFVSVGDSPMRKCSGDVPATFFCTSTQAARGENYRTRMQQLLQLQGLDGYGFVVGVDWWQMADNRGQDNNFGLFTLRDNAYDGIQARVAISRDAHGNPRGGEAADYGDALSAIRCANLLWRTDRCR